MDTTRTKRDQKILNAKIRLAIRDGQLPYTFIDEYERDYRKIVYNMSIEIGKKLTVNKKGNVWTIALA